ncbi:MAG: efflux RND transporter periplasmic adaptor subunit [Pseudomonadota bacterium]
MSPFSQSHMMTSLLVILITSLMTAGCQKNQSSETISSNIQTIHHVSLIKIERQNLPVIYPVPGTVVPKERLQITSRINGIIEAIHVDEGDVVEPGIVLVEIDDTQIEARIKGADASLSSALAEKRDAGEDVKRFQGLAKTQALAQDQLRDALVRKTQAEASVAQARAELEAARKERRYAQLISPSRAQVRERLQDPGELATTGTPILQLDALGPMELEIFLPSSRIDAVTPGQDVDVYIQSGDIPLRGKVGSIIHSADEITRNCKIKITLPNHSRLTPGQFGRAHLILGQSSDILVPTTSVTERAGIEGVYVSDEMGHVRFRSLRLGKAWQDKHEVLAGIEAGAWVILDPPVRLREGDRVKQAMPHER